VNLYPRPPGRTKETEVVPAVSLLLALLDKRFGKVEKRQAVKSDERRAFILIYLADTAMPAAHVDVQVGVAKAIADPDDIAIF
jgi:hypothetical protein